MLARFGLERRRWRLRISDTQRQWRQAVVICARVLGSAISANTRNSLLATWSMEYAGIADIGHYNERLKSTHAVESAVIDSRR